ncbi:MAG: hypothetical protein AAFQ01_01210, partial [Bacteroidota bacterium]
MNKKLSPLALMTLMSISWGCGSGLNGLRKQLNRAPQMKTTREEEIAVLSAINDPDAGFILNETDVYDDENDGWGHYPGSDLDSTPKTPLDKLLTALIGLESNEE